MPKFNLQKDFNVAKRDRDGLECHHQLLSTSVVTYVHSYVA